MHEILFPLILVTVASVFQDTFGLGMKCFKPLPGDAWWLIHSTLAMLIVPLVWASLVVPDLFGSIALAPKDAVFMSILFGFL